MCVALVKEKVKKPSKPNATTSAPAPPVQTIITSNSSSNSSTSEIQEVNNSTTPPTTNEEITTTSKKRKSREPYKFPARTIRLILHAPIELTVKKNVRTTGVPSGTTTKQIPYDISKFYLKKTVEDATRLEMNDDSDGENDGIAV